MKLVDVAAERAVLAAVIQGGQDTYADIAGLVTTRTFGLDSNQNIWACIDHICKDFSDVRIDYPSIMSAAHALGISKEFEKQEEHNHLRAVMNLPVRPENGRKMAAKIRKLEVTRLLENQIDVIKGELSETTGDETIDQIINKVEGPIFDFTSLLQTQENKSIRRMGDGFEEYMNHLVDNPRDMVGISTGFKRFDKAIGGGLRANSVDVIAARPKTGKAQPMDSVIQTPNGFKYMKDIKPGDEVCTPFGGVTTVESIHPQGVLPVYKVKFRGKESVECCGDHLWEVVHSRWQDKHLKTTKEISKDLFRPEGQKRRPKWVVKLPEPVFRHEKPVPIDPWLLGVLIGNGCLRHAVCLSTAEQEIVDSISAILPDDYAINRMPGTEIDYRISRLSKNGQGNVFKAHLDNLGLMGHLSKDKFVPEIYKYNSIEVRLALVQGLLDTDGSADKSGRSIEYSTASEVLADDFCDMVNSLGFLTTKCKRFTKCEGKWFPSWRVHVKGDDTSKLFRLKRKKGRCAKRQRRPLKRPILDIVPAGYKQCQCIKLADPRGLYLTNHYVVTHNTQLVDSVALTVSGQGIPVLNLDTEMSWEEHSHRIAGNLAGIPVRDIECGRFGEHRNKIKEASKKLRDMPYDYLCISGWEFEDVICAIRRWILRTVGLDENGKAKPCAIIYDYIKLTSSESLKNGKLAEHQLIGFIASTLKNFAGRYSIPVLTFAQLNRDGIDREDSSAISLSDRISWFCTSVSIYKRRLMEERNMDIKCSQFTHKIIPLFSRNGEGLDDNDFIYVKADYRYSRIEEGPLHSEAERRKNVGEVVTTGGTPDGPVDF